MDSEGLTKSGLEVARCNKNERLRELACDAVRKAPIIASLVERYGNSIIADPDREKIEAFLFFEVGLSPSTAKRRSSTIVTWMKYLWENSEDGN